VNAGDILLTVLLGVISTIIGFFVIYSVFRPRMSLRPRVLIRPPSPQKRRLFSRQPPTDGARGRYHVVFQNRGFLTVYDVRVQVRLRIPKANTRTTFHLVDVPTTLSYLPSLQRQRRSDSQTPRLLLNKIDWTGIAAPTNPLDLQLLMRELNGILYVSLTATTSILQVMSVAKIDYDWQDILAGPPPDEAWIRESKRRRRVRHTRAASRGPR
jgi:hypothetical protein